MFWADHDPRSEPIARLDNTRICPLFAQEQGAIAFKTFPAHIARGIACSELVPLREAPLVAEGVTPLGT
jgi:hypothetical protein